MVISDYGKYSGFNLYNSLRREIPQMPTEELLNEQLKGKNSETEKAAEVVDIQEAGQRQTLQIKDVTSYALSSDMKVDKTLIGADSDIAKLDIAKAVSDIKKDNLLSQYTYFVGNITTEDGSVTRMKRAD